MGSKGNLIGIGSLLVGAIIWEIAARLFFKPIILPPLSLCLVKAVEMIETGDLQQHVAASMGRILSGFVIGSALGIFLGLLMGTVKIVHRFLDPIINFLRFIPPIAWVSPVLIWFGIGETGKILLIIYTVTFMVLINTLAGVFSLHKNKIRAALCFGATGVQRFRLVTVPGTVGYMLVGMQIAMSNAFVTIVTAEMLAAQRGLGYVILVSKNFGATDTIFVGMATLGALGLVSDLLFGFFINKYGVRYLPVRK